MRPHPVLAALLILAAPQAIQPRGQVNSTPAAEPTPVGSGVRGSDKAPITILVFSDFESFPCARSASVIDGLLQQTRDVRVIFKHAPAASNPNAMLAHEASLAAGAQGKFWEMHNLLFENQTKTHPRRLTRLRQVTRPRLSPIRARARQPHLPPHRRARPGRSGRPRRHHDADVLRQRPPPGRPARLRIARRGYRVATRR